MFVLREFASCEIGDTSQRPQAVTTTDGLPSVISQTGRRMRPGRERTIECDCASHDQQRAHGSAPVGVCTYFDRSSFRFDGHSGAWVPGYMGSSNSLSDTHDDQTVHVPVMLTEVLHWLDVAPGKLIADGTVGGGGHARAIAAAVQPAGRVLGVDRDERAIQRATSRCDGYPVTLALASYDELPEVVQQTGFGPLQGIVLDLGFSSDQIADRDRGFSYLLDGPLDLRYDTRWGEPASQWLAQRSEREIADVIYQYGEERFSRRIAKRIVETRKSHPIRTSGQLADLVRSCVPRSKNHRIDPATRTFQALRIAVNDELAILERALRRIPDLLVPGGRLVVMSFHSLEDRIVKQAFRDDPRLEVLTKKPLQAQPLELEQNPRARSAKLRAAVRVTSA